MSVIDMIAGSIMKQASGGKTPSSSPTEGTSQTVAKGKKTKNKGKKTDTSTVKSTALIMQYDEAYYNGMMRKGKEYSICYSIPNVTFRGVSQAKQEEVMESFVGVLNSFDSYLKITLVIANVREDADLASSVRYPVDQFPLYAEELNRIFRDKLSVHNQVTTYKLFVIKGSFDNPMDAANQFATVTHTLDDLFTQAWQVRGEWMSIGTRLHLIATILNKDAYNPYLLYKKEENDYTVDIDLLKKQGLNVDTIINPSYIKFDKKDFLLNERIGRSYYLSKIGNSISTDFLFSLYNTDAEMVIAIDMNGIESGDAIRRLNNKYSQILAEVEQKDGFQTLEQVSEQESILNMQDGILNHDEKSYNASIVLTLFAEDKKELENLQQQIFAKAKRHTCAFDILLASQRYGLQTCCLMGFYSIEFKRFFNAHSLGAFIPFDVPEYFDGDGIYYGLHRINNLPIFYDRNKNDNYNALVLGRSGCVDAKTEFFNGKEWKSIADYVEGEQVLQYDPQTDEATLVQPTAYIKKPCDEMYHMETKYGINQMLSGEHRVLYYTRSSHRKGDFIGPHVDSMEDVYKKQEADAFRGLFKTSFQYEGCGIDLTDTEIKLMLAVFADGHFNANNENSKCVRFNLKKDRKKQALEALLKEAGYTQKPHELKTRNPKEYGVYETEDGYTHYSFYAPIREKHFSEMWYNCNAHQLQVICDNVLQWDGHIDDKNRRQYTSTNAADADFVQFAFTACGYRATVSENQRKGETYHTNGSAYTRKSNEYEVCISDNVYVGLSVGKNKTKITKEVPEDGYKYCFTVPSSFLVLRRNGRIFTTGNSGKSFFVKREILLTRLRHPKDNIYIIDPDGEYTYITEQLGGEVIDLRAGNGVYLNPLDLNIDSTHSKDENPVVSKSDLIASLVETMMGGGIVLNSKSKSILDRCVRRIYQPYLDHLNLLPPDKNGHRVTIDRAACPTLQDLYDQLLRQPEIEAQEIAISIETYITGSFDTFAHRTNINTDNTFIDFNIQGLDSNMMDLGLRICLSELWNRMVANRAKNIWTRMFIDEFHNLLSTELSAQFCKKLWKQARKWMGAPTGITQNTEDLLQSTAARAIINNSGLVVLLNQSELDQEVLGQILHLDKTDLNYVNKVKPGYGLIVTNSVTIPFYDEFPTDTQCFKLLDTSPNSEKKEELS